MGSDEAISDVNSPMYPPLSRIILAYLRAQALLLLPELWCELGTEVFSLKHLANLDL